MSTHPLRRSRRGFCHKCKWTGRCSFADGQRLYCEFCGPEVMRKERQAEAVHNTYR